MSVLDVISAAWAIRPEVLEQIQDIYHAHARGEKTEWLKEFQARGGPGNEQGSSYVKQDRVAVIAINGPIAQRMSMFHAISGGTSTDALAQQLQAALADPMVDGIVLAIDSPGGTVSGTQSLAKSIAAARAAKPILAWTDATIASAAYWLASGAEQIFIDSDTAQVGSIGVVAAHRDVSRAEEKAGVKTTEIYAGKYKRIASNFAPLTEEGRASIQDQVDYYFGVFVGDVAENRGVPIAQVLSGMADGRIFIGRQAIDAGLVDGVASFDEVVSKVKTMAAERRAAKSKERYMSMTKEQLVAEHKDLAAELVAEGASAERARIASIREQLLPGHEALVDAMIADGTSVAEAAMRILAAERESRGKAAAERQADAPAPLANAAPADDVKDASAGDKVAQARAHAQAKGISYVEAHKALFGNSIH